jgi:uncharacterized membrane protein YqiK
MDVVDTGPIGLILVVVLVAIGLVLWWSRRS